MNQYRITDLFPSPVVMALGGKDYTVGQLRVRDLATLTRHLEQHHPHPHEANRERIGKAGGEERWKVLGRVWREARDWHPSLGDDTSSEFYSSAAGIIVFLYVALSVHNEISVEDAIGLAGSIAIEEFQALQRVAYNVTPQSELERAFDDDRLTDDEVPWCEILDGIARDRGWTYDDVGDLTLSQLAVAQCKGVRPSKARRVLPGEDLQKLVEERRRKFYGE